MAKNKSDTIKILEVLDTLVIPKLETIEQDVSGLKKDVSGLKKDMADVKEELIDVHATTNRIETLVKSEVKYVDDLSVRVTKLEKKPA